MNYIKTFESEFNQTNNGISIALKDKPSTNLKFSLERISEEIKIGEIDVNIKTEYDKILDVNLVVYSYHPNVLSYISNDYTNVDNVDLIYNKLNRMKTLYSDEISSVYKTKSTK